MGIFKRLREASEYKEQKRKERAERFKKFRKRPSVTRTQGFSKKIVSRLTRPPKKYQGRTGKRGRGRPRGSYKYFIPGKGPVSVFEWRSYLSRQKQLMKMRLQQMKARQQVYSPYQQQALQQQIQQQMVQPQAQVQTRRMPPAIIQEPTYDQQPSELRIWEDTTGIGLNPNTQQQPQMFYEQDLATGQMKLKKGGSFL